MNKIEALELLTQATGTVTANREGHQKIIEAIEVLREAISKKTQKE